MKLARTFLLIAIVSADAADVVIYEADKLPEDEGWTHDAAGTFGAQRHIDRGWFVQFVDLPSGVPGPLGNADFYRRSLSAFAGEERFFVEWKVETDAPSVVLDVSGIPVALACSGTSAAFYHTTMTTDRVQLLRDTQLPLVFVGIEPDQAHIYRLELYDGLSYAWFIDGTVVHSGAPEGPYPSPDSEIVWGVRRHTFDATTRWDYIRYGTIPQDASGDYDSDAAVGLDDFYFFHECLSDARPELPGGPKGNSGPGCRFADFDFDTDTDLRDFAAFQNAFGQPQ